jgi:hypothetical protein
MFGKKEEEDDGSIKAQSFEVSAKRGIAVLQKKIRKWLAAHPDIEIVSTDFAGFGDSIGYVILFRGIEVPGAALDEESDEGRLDFQFQEGGAVAQPAAPRVIQRPPTQGAPVPLQRGGLPEKPEAKKPFRLGPGKTQPQRHLQQAANAPAHGIQGTRSNPRQQPSQQAAGGGDQMGAARQPQVAAPPRQQQQMAAPSRQQQQIAAPPQQQPPRELQKPMAPPLQQQQPPMSGAVAQGAAISSDQPFGQGGVQSPPRQRAVQFQGAMPEYQQQSAPQMAEHQQQSPAAPQQVQEPSRPMAPEGGEPARTGFTTGAIFGNFDAFKPADEG